MPRGPSAKRARAELAGRLRARRAEIEEAAFTRIKAISDPAEVADPIYLDGLRSAVSAAIDYGLDTIEASEGHVPALPAVLRAQAQLAARNGVGLDTVLRRYFAGYTLLGDFLVREAAGRELPAGLVSAELLQDRAALFERLIATVSEEYAREADAQPDSPAGHRAERVRRLLDGEMLDSTDLAYDFDAHHLGAIAKGVGAPEALRSLASTLGLRQLIVASEEDRVWAWFGGRRPLGFDDLRTKISLAWPARITLALGEPAEGIAGWRLTHRQAAAALPVALRGSKPLVRYGDVALLASVLQDDLVATSLHRLYLTPLRLERDGGEIARKTLRAYFVSRRNISSAAASLGVSRRTVSSRLRAIEDRLGLRLDTPELELALSLEEVGGAAHTHAF
ncbi:MAG TPA: helix-turn-helix domain-containing protein [Solirubrobacterales bacterium]|nr:helix-turn-helix domain-containing protein [Solirubrobacterales bacterium]